MLPLCSALLIALLVAGEDWSRSLFLVVLPRVVVEGFLVGAVWEDPGRAGCGWLKR